MTILHALLLGIVEGLTEFLPISSTFHLIFTSTLMGLKQTEFQTMFEVFIQSGAILAVVLLYAKMVWSDLKLLKNIIVSFIPTAIVGFALHSVIKHFFFESNGLMLAAFMSVGVLFIAYEWWLKKHPGFLKRTANDITWKEAALVGLGQAAAVLPGVSRAGAVMVSMMLMRVKRDEAAKYSFLLAVPTICAAAALDLIKLKSATAISRQEVLLLTVGFVTAFVTALAVLRWFISYLQRHTLTSFGVYRLVMGLVLLVWIF